MQWLRLGSAIWPALRRETGGVVCGQVDARTVRLAGGCCLLWRAGFAQAQRGFACVLFCADRLGWAVPAA